MESFFSRYKNAFVLIAVLLAQAIGLATQVRRQDYLSHSDSRAISLVRSVITTIITPPERLFLHIGHGIRNTWSSYIGLRRTHEQNLELKKQLDDLRVQERALAEDARQGQRLQALLAFKQQYVAKTIAAQVVGTSGVDQAHLLLIDKGSNDGLQPDMAVITPDGIVGKLRDVFPGTAQLLLINDASSGAGVILENTRIRGVLRGSTSGQAQIGNLLPDDRIKTGEPIVTSGGDRIFPRGLSVGTVASVTLDPDHPPYTLVRIRPSANLEQLEEVLVITDVATHLAAATSDPADITPKSETMADHLPGLKDPAADAAKAPGTKPTPLDPKTAIPLPKPDPTLHPDKYSPGASLPANQLHPGGRNPDGAVTIQHSTKPVPEQ